MPVPSAIRCSKCRKHYGRPDGCAICEPAKNAIIWPDLMDDALGALESILGQNLGILQKLQTRMEQEIDNTTTKSWSPQLNADALKLSQAMKAISAEVRQYQKDQTARVKKMGFEEKSELFLDFFKRLPREYQMKLADSVGEQLRRISGPPKPAGHFDDGPYAPGTR